MLLSCPRFYFQALLYGCFILQLLNLMTMAVTYSYPMTLQFSVPFGADEVPRVESKLRVFLFKIQFNTQVWYLKIWCYL